MLFDKILCVVIIDLSNKKHDIPTPEVKKWLNNILVVIENGIDFPLYIHCFSGKNRTGVVVATLISILEIPKETIIQEYLLSNGDVSRELIDMALNGIQPIESTFRHIHLKNIRKFLLY